MEIQLVGIPMQDGSKRLGCEMGPSALRVAGISQTLEQLGHQVTDAGDVRIPEVKEFSHPHKNDRLYKPENVSAWIDAISERIYEACQKGFPICMGGDHAMAAGTVRGIKRYADEQNRPLFVLWLDAHADFHTLETTPSGNLHGTPLSYLSGNDSFNRYFPDLTSPVKLENICLFGIRSIEMEERTALANLPIDVIDMRMIDEFGVADLLSKFLERVKQANGMLHVSFDVDFLDPSIAPAVGTLVPGGATFREAHLIMEILHDSGLVTSMDLTELNPFLDNKGKTAHLMVDFAASLFGKKVMDRPSQSFSGM